MNRLWLPPTELIVPTRAGSPRRRLRPVAYRRKRRCGDCCGGGSTGINCAEALSVLGNISQINVCVVDSGNFAETVTASIAALHSGSTSNSSTYKNLEANCGQPGSGSFFVDCSGDFFGGVTRVTNMTFTCDDANQRFNVQVDGETHTNTNCNSGSLLQSWSGSFTVPYGETCPALAANILEKGFTDGATTVRMHQVWGSGCTTFGDTCVC